MNQARNELGVKQERCGRRDEMALSRRHRLWGFDLPAVDLDFLEYDNGEPVALIEYKRWNGAKLTIKQPSLRAIVRLADLARLPAFCVRYQRDCSMFRVIPLNNIAGDLTGGRRIEMPEVDYVSFLYALRKRNMPERIRRVIAGNDPGEVLY